MTAPMSTPSSWRTVISAWPVMKAASSLVASSPVPASSRAVGAQEQVAAVTVELGPLAAAQGSLDGQRMQAELLAQHGEVVVVGIEQVQPDGDRDIGQVIADVGDREALELEPPAAVQPRARLAPGRADLADSGRGPHLLALRACGVRDAGRR